MHNTQINEKKLLLHNTKKIKRNWREISPFNCCHNFFVGTASLSENLIENKHNSSNDQNVDLQDIKKVAKSKRMNADGEGLEEKVCDEVENNTESTCAALRRAAADLAELEVALRAVLAELEVALRAVLDHAEQEAVDAAAGEARARDQHLTQGAARGVRLAQRDVADEANARAQVVAATAGALGVELARYDLAVMEAEWAAADLHIELQRERRAREAATLRMALEDAEERAAAALRAERDACAAAALRAALEDAEERAERDARAAVALRAALEDAEERVAAALCAERDARAAAALRAALEDAEERAEREARAAAALRAALEDVEERTEQDQHLTQGAARGVRLAERDVADEADARAQDVAATAGALGAELARYDVALLEAEEAAAALHIELQRERRAREAATLPMALEDVEECAERDARAAAALRAALEDAEECAERDARAAAALRAALEDAEKRAEQDARAAAALRAALEVAEARAGEEERQRRELAATVAGLERDLSSAGDRNEELARQLEDREEREFELKEEKDALEEERNTLREQKDVLAEKSNALQDERDALLEERDDLLLEREVLLEELQGERGAVERPTRKRHAARSEEHGPAEHDVCALPVPSPASSRAHLITGYFRDDSDDTIVVGPRAGTRPRPDSPRRNF